MHVPVTFGYLNVFDMPGMGVAELVKEMKGQDASITWGPIKPLRHLPLPLQEQIKSPLSPLVAQSLDRHDSMSGRPSKSHRRECGERCSAIVTGGKT